MDKSEKKNDLPVSDKLFNLLREASSSRKEGNGADFELMQEGLQDSECQSLNDLYQDVLNALKFKDITLHLLHADPLSSLGGVERYFKELSRALLNSHQTSSVCLFPMSKGIRRRYGFIIDGVMFAGFSPSSVKLVLDFIVCIEGIKLYSTSLHHAKDWLNDDLHSMIDWSEKHTHRINYVVHDYHSICKQPFLLENDKTFCGPPTENKLYICESCSNGAGIKEHRANYAAILKHVSNLIFPSEVAAEVFSRVYELSDFNTAIFPIYELQESKSSNDSSHQDQDLSIIYIGSPAVHKGLNQFGRLISEFGERFNWIVVGQENPFHGNSNVSHIPFSFQKEGSNMVDLLKSLSPAYAFLGSICKETFSFSVFEVIASGLGVLTTKESGNIAAVTSAQHAGVVAEDIEGVIDFLSRDDTKLLDQISKISSYEISDRSNKLAELFISP